MDSSEAWSIGECAARCNNVAGCQAIEWSESETKCNLMNHKNPDGPGWKDFVFCSKNGRYIYERKKIVAE